MAYFPFFVELSKLRGVIIGGGRVAAGKVMRLLEYGANISVTATDISDEIVSLCGEHTKMYFKSFTEDDLDSADYVIAATGNHEVNLEVYRAARKRHLPVNVVDEPQLCDFIFPSVYSEGKLVIGVTTSGAAPFIGSRIRDKIDTIVPDNIDTILDYLAEARVNIKQNIPEEHRRRQIMMKLSEYCVETGTVPTQDLYTRICKETY
ncbi:MAG: bifunctional precorrin-2 dehydrogenase/sirohydrochlorin ferrochelatase [Lachnospiraceae bacterium]